MDQYLLDEAERHLQDAVRKWEGSTTESERVIWAQAMEQWRGVLIVQHHYTIEDVGRVIESA